MAGVILAVDASTYEGSVAVIRDGAVVAERTVTMRSKSEERLMPALVEALAEHSSFASVEGVVCGAGPGSFTSLRIAASLCKGVAHARRIPLYAVPSLALAAVEAGEGRWCMTMDALRGDVFVGAYVWDGRLLTALPGWPGLVAEREVESLAAKEDLQVRRAAPHARATVHLIDELLGAGPVDLALWEPEYGRLAEAQARWEAAHGPLRP